MKHMRRYVARTVVVNCGRVGSFTGTLDAADADSITISHAQMLEPQNSDLSGVVVLRANRIDWVQVV